MPVDEVRVVEEDVGCEQGQSIVMQNGKEDDGYFLALRQFVPKFYAQSRKEKA